MPKNYNKKNIEKRAFVEYYSNKGLETFINDMEKVCETSKDLNDLEEKSKQLKSKTHYKDLQDIAQKRVKYILNLPIGKKAKFILTKAANDLVQRNELKEGYKNTILILEDLIKCYRELFNEKYEEFIIISSLEEIYLN